jgi:uncharacterized protein (TIGR02599 family)
MFCPAAPHPVRRTRLLRPVPAAFTLIELLLSMTILSVLMLIVTNVISVVQKTWVRANSRVSEFREARGAFDTIARNLSQATLNVYWQSVDPLGTATRTFQRVGATPNAVLANNYVRQSELQFVTGPATSILGGAATGADNPGHAVFFQAPLGITRLAAAGGGQVNTENMVNLLCGRGYFVAWGDDLAFRPAFLNVISTVRPRKRFRLMEYSPTAEKNRIYDSALRPIVNPTDPTQNFSKQWFQLDLTAGNTQAVAGETAADRAIVRPVADNVLCLVVCPELEAKAKDPSGNAVPPNSIAPQYQYDSLLKTNPGATATGFGPQGTQHLLPPLIKITMIVVDTAGGEKFAEDDGLRQNVAGLLQSKFTDASNYDTPNSAYRQDMAGIESFLVQNRINYRIFTTTVIMKQARWSA